MTAESVLSFWFVEIEAKQWWTKSAEFDQLIAARFGSLHAAAARCELYAWRETRRAGWPKSSCWTSFRATCTGTSPRPLPAIRWHLRWRKPLWPRRPIALLRSGKGPSSTCPICTVNRPSYTAMRRHCSAKLGWRAVWPPSNTTRPSSTALGAIRTATTSSGGPRPPKSLNSWPGRAPPFDSFSSQP